MCFYKLKFYIIILFLVAYSSCDPNEGKSPPPAKVYMVQKYADMDTIEQGIDAIPESNGIRIEWYLLADPDIEYYAIKRKAQDESIFSPLTKINVENIISPYDTVFSYIDNDSIKLDVTESYNYYYVYAVNKDGIAGDNSDTVKYRLYSKPIIDDDTPDINLNEQPVLRWRFQGGNIPNYYIIRLEELMSEKFIWTRKYLSGFGADQEKDLSTVNNPPDYQSNIIYRWRIDVVGTDSLASGSESNWKTFTVH